MGAWLSRIEERRAASLIDPAFLKLHQEHALLAQKCHEECMKLNEDTTRYLGVDFTWNLFPVEYIKSQCPVPALHSGTCATCIVLDLDKMKADMEKERVEYKLQKEQVISLHDLIVSMPNPCPFNNKNHDCWSCAIQFANVHDLYQWSRPRHKWSHTVERYRQELLNRQKPELRRLCDAGFCGTLTNQDIEDLSSSDELMQIMTVARDRKLKFAQSMQEFDRYPCGYLDVICLLAGEDDE